MRISNIFDIHTIETLILQNNVQKLLNQIPEWNKFLSGGNEQVILFKKKIKSCYFQKFDIYKSSFLKSPAVKIIIESLLNNELPDNCNSEMLSFFQNVILGNSNEFYKLIWDGLIKVSKGFSFLFVFY